VHIEVKLSHRKEGRSVHCSFTQVMHSKAPRSASHQINRTTHVCLHSTSAFSPSSLNAPVHLEIAALRYLCPHDALPGIEPRRRRGTDAWKSCSARTKRQQLCRSSRCEAMKCTKAEERDMCSMRTFDLLYCIWGGLIYARCVAFKLSCKSSVPGNKCPKMVALMK